MTNILCIWSIEHWSQDFLCASHTDIRWTKRWTRRGMLDLFWCFRRRFPVLEENVDKKISQVKKFHGTFKVENEQFLLFSWSFIGKRFRERRLMIVDSVTWVSEFLFDDDRSRALRLFKVDAAIASNAVSRVMMNEQVIRKFNFHGTKRCRNVDRWSARLF